MTQQLEIGDRVAHQNGNGHDANPALAVTLINGISLSLHERQGHFEGIGNVEYHGIPLRDGRRPAFIDIRTPDGVQLEDWQIVRSEIGPDRISLEMTPMARPGGLMEWMLHETRPRLNTVDWSLPPRPAAGTKLRLDIEPVTRRYGTDTAVGLRYRYHYDSAEYPIYKILDRATWEPGGEASANEFWFRNSFAPCIYSFANKNHVYNTEWYQPSASNCDIFQFLPWQTALEGFTLTHHDEGALVTWATQVSHVRSYFEKPASTDAVFHWHEHCGDLGSSFSSSPMEVLWLPGRRDRVARWNLYEAIREDVYNALHDDIGMRRERVTPYGVIEEWNVPDFDRYRERGLPKLLDAGLKTIFLPNEFENNMNTFGVSNMCCTIDYKVAETVGEEKLTAFCRAAQQGGAKVEMWGNTALSTLTPIFANRNGDPQRVDFLPEAGSVVDVLRASADPYVRNASGAIEADHYTPVFAQLNLRDSTIRGYWMTQWKKAHDEIGIQGIFLDSSCNMTSDKFHWIANPSAQSGSGATVDQTHLLGFGRPGVEPPRAILSQYRAHLELMADMQRMGYAYCGEDVGVFGTHRSGPDIVKRLDNIPMWSDGLVGFDGPAIRAAGVNPDDIFFKGLAFRMMWFVYWDIERDELTYRLGGARGDFDQPSDWHISLFKAYSAIDPEMSTREILPGEDGVLYTAPGGASQVLWSFVPFTLSLPGVSIVDDILSGETKQVNTLNAEARRIYRITQSTGASPISME